MSKQREILVQVLDYVRKVFPDSPIYLSGSVCLGHEIPESDIDLLIIVSDISDIDYPDGKLEWEDSNFKLLRAYFKNVPLHLHFGTIGLLTEFEKKPWRAYKFLKMEKLYDPNGIVLTYKERIAPWFTAHPDISKLWDDWLTQWTVRNVSKGKKQGKLIRQYPDVDLWWPHLDQIVKREKAKNPCKGCPPQPTATPWVLDTTRDVPCKGTTKQETLTWLDRFFKCMDI